jgi:hypothetical protein
MSSFPTHPIQIRMGGYGPPTTTHSRALKMIGDRLGAEFGDAVDIKYIWNVMDLGSRNLPHRGNCCAVDGYSETTKKQSRRRNW